jgi:hypothetical protein
MKSAGGGAIAKNLRLNVQKMPISTKIRETDEPKDKKRLCD